MSDLYLKMFITFGVLIMPVCMVGSVFRKFRRVYNACLILFIALITLCCIVGLLKLWSI
jgi:hypothetical protein